MYYFYNGQKLGEFYYTFLCDFCCTPDIYAVEHPEDGYTSDRNT
jgi:hypothetical protein